MKVKTSVTLAEDVLKAVDEQAGDEGNRSAFIEQAVRAYLAGIARKASEARDLEIINRSAKRLNDEAGDVLNYQSME
jgi:metal-responsive CopG/Arc/MetJ family transcriptional regulator